MSTANKLLYLGETKSKIKDVANMTGAGIDNNTTFRNYAQALYDGYINVLKDRGTLLDNMPKLTSTGSISEGLGLPIYEDKMSKLSTQDGTPTPSSPQEVKTVKGYRNLFDKDNASYKNGYIKNNTGNETSSDLSSYLLTYIPVEPNKEYTIQGSLISSSNGCRIYFYDNNKNWISRTNVIWNIPASFETPNNCYYIQFQYTQSVYNENSVQINEGNIAFPYVPYGTNWIYTTITDGTNTKNILLPLNNNEIVGIGDYKDEYIVDKNGHCWLNKKTGKVVLDGSETGWSDIGGNAPYSISIENSVITSSNAELPNILVYNFTTRAYNETWTVSNYLACAGGTSYPSRIRFRNTDISSLTNWKTWLSTHNTEIYYVLAEPQLIDLNYNVDLTLYSGTNNITNSEDMDMSIKYIKDTYE